MSSQLSLRDHLALMVIGSLALQPVAVFLWMAGWAQALPDFIPLPMLIIGGALSGAGVIILITYALSFKQKGDTALRAMAGWTIAATILPFLAGAQQACWILGSLCLIGLLVRTRTHPEESLQWQN